jgi:Ca2+-binding RTX toxin-like protein
MGGADTMSGGAGQDTADYGDRSAAVTVTTDGVANDGASGEADNVQSDVDSIVGGSGDDRLTGGAGPDVLLGDAGDDTLAGNAGNDVLLGGDGDNSLNMGAGDDVAFAGAGDDTVRGFAGHDAVFAGAGDDDLQWNDPVGDTVFGDSGDDRILGGDAAADVIHGGADDDFIQAFTTAAANATAGDRLYGDGGNDTVIGGNASDFIEGGEGNDTLTGNGAADVFAFGSNLGQDTVTDFNPDEDFVQIVGTTTAAAFGDPLARLSASGGNTVLDLGDGDTVTFLGVAPSDFTADNFLFGLA